MMIDRRLIAAVPQTRRNIALSVVVQWCALVANIHMTFAICGYFDLLLTGTAAAADLGPVLVSMAVAAIVRLAASVVAADLAWRSSREVKHRLRTLVFEKLLRLGSGYRERVSTSEAVQVAVEGVEQLETYFASYLPQLFYALIAPLTLFAALVGVSAAPSIVLLVCVPLIPVAIAAVQTWAKRLLSQYWGRYTELGDTFLENLQGLTTLKIYQADEARHREMNRQAEEFRRITMRVLTMQLNSISIMDLVAYGGAALGIALAIWQLGAGGVGAGDALAIALLSAEFFIPMRLLGSFFHIAMNGMAASEKLFRIVDAVEPAAGSAVPTGTGDVRLAEVCFTYDGTRQVLQQVALTAPAGSLTAIVGVSGSGKSTIASLLTGRSRGYSGSIQVGGVEVSAISGEDLARTVTYVGHACALFRGTVRDNLLMAAPDAGDDELWAALDTARLTGFLDAESGLDTPITEGGANLSGGQRQRLALARALLHDSPVYVFDEATSNVDVESEDAIMRAIFGLRGKKTVLVVSHRLSSVTGADRICVMDAGRLVESGTHGELMARGGRYAQLWRAQQDIENLDGKVVA